MSKCDHYDRRQVWVEEEDWYSGEKIGRWNEIVTCLQEDISIGAFKCSRCGEVGYYTGKWRAYYESAGAAPTQEEPRAAP